MTLKKHPSIILTKALKESRRIAQAALVALRSIQKRRDGPGRAVALVDPRSESRGGGE